MSHQENEVSWHVLRRIVHAWAGDAAELAEVKPLTGGCINTTLALTTEAGDRAVLKISPHRVNRDVEREAYQLGLLRSLGLPVPQVYKSHLATLDEPHSYLLMEYVDGHDLAAARQACTPEQYDALQRELAEIVLTLHGRRGEAYFRDHGPIEMPRFESWVEFYRHVYDPIWVDVEKSPVLPAKVRRHIRKIHDRLDRLLVHDDAPRLAHWDIWSGNVVAAPNGDGGWHVRALLDPNCKYAHAEAEIAYMELFHTVTPAFLQAYQAERKLGEGYHRVRKPVYQLYEMISHVHGFGHEYVKPLIAAWERAAALV